MALGFSSAHKLMLLKFWMAFLEKLECMTQISGVLVNFCKNMTTCKCQNFLRTKLNN